MINTIHEQSYLLNLRKHLETIILSSFSFTIPCHLSHVAAALVRYNVIGLIPKTKQKKAKQQLSLFGIVAASIGFYSRSQYLLLSLLF